MKYIMTWFIAKHSYILSLFGILSIVVNLYIYQNLNDWSNRASACERYRKIIFEDEYFQKAVRMRISRYKEPYQSIFDSTYPNVVHVRNEVCVALTPIGVGGEPVYCFDRNTKKVTWFDPGGE